MRNCRRGKHNESSAGDERARRRGFRGEDGSLFASLRKQLRIWPAWRERMPDRTSSEVQRARSKITRCRLDSWNAVGECPATTQSFCQPLTKRYSLESYSTISYRVIHRVWHGRVTAELCVLESKSRMCGTSVSLGAGGGGGAVSRQRDGSSVCNKLRCRGKPSVCPRRQRHSLPNKRQPVDGPRLVEHGYQR